MYNVYITVICVIAPADESMAALEFFGCRGTARAPEFIGYWGTLVFPCYCRQAISLYRLDLSKLWSVQKCSDILFI